MAKPSTLAKEKEPDFQHAKGALSATADEDNAELKLSRIKAIRATRLDVGLVIHRHNIENGKVAFQIEAALIDAYPGLTNQVAGHGLTTTDAGMSKRSSETMPPSHSKPENR